MVLAMVSVSFLARTLEERLPMGQFSRFKPTFKGVYWRLSMRPMQDYSSVHILSLLQLFGYSLLSELLDVLAPGVSVDSMYKIRIK